MEEGDDNDNSKDEPVQQWHVLDVALSEIQEWQRYGCTYIIFILQTTTFGSLHFISFGPHPTVLVPTHFGDHFPFSPPC